MRLIFGKFARSFFMYVFKPTVFLFLTLLAFSCSNRTLLRESRTRCMGRNALAFIQDVRQKKSEALDAFIATLSEQERLAQLFVINIEGNEKFSFVERLENDGNPSMQKGSGAAALIPGGYIFFSFNISPEPETIAAFTDSVRSFARGENKIEPFLCLDAEGGYVNRLRGIAGPLPENIRVSKCLGAEEAADLYRLNAVQLRALGFDMNLSPVAEVLTKQNEKFLDGRSFGNAGQVKKYAAAAIVSYEKNKVGAVLKHFPGNNDVDPHFSLPYIEYTQGNFAENVIDVYSSLVEAEPSGVLLSHAIVGVEGLDTEEKPASLSSLWANDMLRKTLHFGGIVLSDDIFMAALEKHGFTPERAVREAVLAGVNCILMSEKRFINEFELAKKLYHADGVFRAAADESVRHMLDFKLKTGILRFDFDGSRWNVLRAGQRLSVEERMKTFYAARKENAVLYDEYFLDTADDNELNAVRIK